ncbi:klp6, partial [Symbiodinium microadriaticum]
MFGRTDKWNEALPGESRRFEGVVQASLIAIFDHINSCHKRGERAELFISFYEIYLERVRDLLVQSPSHRGCPSGPSLTVRENADKGAFVEGLSTFSVRDMDAVYDLIHRSVANRVTHELAMNRSSSRSHAILQVTLEQDCREGRDDGMTDEEAERVKESKGKRTRAVFTFVDLAGSERVTKTGSTGARLREAKTINKSICALGNCIQAIGGNAKTCIIATVGPCAHSYEETLSTLIFASRYT